MTTATALLHLWKFSPSICVSTSAQKIEGDAENPRVIATEVGVGYRLAEMRMVVTALVSYWHELPVRGVAQVRQLSGVHLPCVGRRQTGEF